MTGATTRELGACASPGCQDLTAEYAFPVSPDVTVLLCEDHYESCTDSLRRTSPGAQAAVVQAIRDTLEEDGRFPGWSHVSNARLTVLTGRGMRTIEHTMTVLKAAGFIAAQYDEGRRRWLRVL